MLKYRAYKYLIKPTHEQILIFKKICKDVLWVRNRYVDDFVNGVNLNRKAIDILNDYKVENPDLKNSDVSALMNILFKLSDKKDLRKKAKSCSSYTVSNLYRRPIYLVNNNYINLPSLGIVEIVYHRPLPEGSKIFSATISRNKLGEYYVTIVFSYEWFNPLINLNINNSIGIDYSNAHFYVDNTGKTINMPHYYELEEERVAELGKKLTKTKTDGMNHMKIKRMIQKKYKRMSNQRRDFLHKLANEISDKYDIVCCETLDMNSVANGFYKLEKRTYDNSFGLFLNILEYKMEDKGKMLVKIDRYFPSSKTCHVCGYVNQDLQVNERKWICPGCKTHLDRDVNAAINIRNEGIRNLNCHRVSGECLSR